MMCNMMTVLFRGGGFPCTTLQSTHCQPSTFAAQHITSHYITPVCKCPVGLVVCLGCFFAQDTCRIVSNMLTILLKRPLHG
jgi:hypothetical protein